jgi:hypothetical protein
VPSGLGWGCRRCAGEWVDRQGGGLGVSGLGGGGEMGLGWGVGCTGWVERRCRLGWGGVAGGAPVSGSIGRGGGGGVGCIGFGLGVFRLGIRRHDLCSCMLHCWDFRWAF